MTLHIISSPSRITKMKIIRNLMEGSDEIEDKIFNVIDISNCVYDSIDELVGESVSDIVYDTTRVSARGRIRISIINSEVTKKQKKLLLKELKS